MTDPDPGAPFRLVVETISKAMDTLPPTTTPDAIVMGLALAAASIAVAVGGTEEDFAAGCREMYKVAFAGKDRASG